MRKDFSAYMGSWIVFLIVNDSLCIKLENKKSVDIKISMSVYPPTLEYNFINASNGKISDMNIHRSSITKKIQICISESALRLAARPTFLLLKSLIYSL